MDGIRKRIVISNWRGFEAPDRVDSINVSPEVFEKITGLIKEERKKISEKLDARRFSTQWLKESV